MPRQAGMLTVKNNPKEFELIAQKTGALMQKGLEDGVQQAAEIVKEAAMANINRKEKRGWSMQDHIVTQMTESTPDSATILIGPSKKSFWGLFVEFGHALVIGSKKKGNRKVIGHVPPHPFMRPALDENIDKVNAAIMDGINKALESGG
jgi:HK97 gp10 family phage protein